MLLYFHLILTKFTREQNTPSLKDFPTQFPQKYNTSSSKDYRLNNINTGLAREQA
jgi:hypothetical protein